MPTSHECICCCEVESVVKMKEEDEGCDSLWLNVSVHQYSHAQTTFHRVSANNAVMAGVHNH